MEKEEAAQRAKLKRTELNLKAETFKNEDLDSDLLQGDEDSSLFGCPLFRQPVSLDRTKEQVREWKKQNGLAVPKPKPKKDKKDKKDMNASSGDIAGKAEAAALEEPINSSDEEDEDEQQRAWERNKKDVARKTWIEELNDAAQNQWQIVVSDDEDEKEMDASA